VQMQEFLRQMVESTGVSGYESRVGELVSQTFAEICDEVRPDVLGNVVALRKGEGQGPRKRVMLAGHMDEIGLMITKIEDSGFLRFTSVGGVDQRTLVSQEVTVHAKQDLLGIIGMKPPHLMQAEDRNRAIPMHDLVIDVGMPAEQARQLVRVGDMVTINRQMYQLGKDVVAGKAMDDRAAVAVIYYCLQELQKLRHQVDVYAVATVQEEVGLRGAIVSTYDIAPDVGIALDVCHGAMPGVEAYRTSPMGKGPNIGFGANIHPKVYERLVDVAKDYSIPYSLGVYAAGTGTDTWAMQVSRAGIATGLISLPSRYMHTSVETVNLSDLKMAGRLLALFISSLDDQFMEGLICY
jgi:putative aminopeptidase FrvX